MSMLSYFNCFRAFLKNCADHGYYVTNFRYCKIGLSYFLYTDSLLVRSLKYIAALRSFLLATPPSERRTAASIQSNERWLLGLCGLAQRDDCQLLSSPRSGALNLLLSILSACRWCINEEIDTNTIFLLEPRLGCDL